MKGQRGNKQVMRLGIFHVALIAFALAGSLLFNSGCTCIFHSDVPFGPHVTGDSNGGAIVFYEAIENNNKHSFYAQKISPDGKTLWGKGVLIDSSYTEFNSFWNLKIASDSAGGAFIVWLSQPLVQEQTFVNYIARLDLKGEILWQKKMSAFYELISDGSGGAIVVTTSIYNQGDFLINRIDSAGNYLWREEGIKLSRDNYSSPQMVSDGSGGLIIYQQLESTLHSFDIRIKRIDSDGNWLLGENGIKLTIEAGEQSAPHNPVLVGSNDNMFIVVWSDIRQGLASLYAQKIDYQGNIKWQPGGMKVCYAKTNASFWPVSAVSDDSGGAIIACSYKDANTNQKVLLAQKLDTEGRTVWGENGITIMDVPHSTHTLSYDSSGGAIIDWGIDKSFFGSAKSYVQRIDAVGNLLWGEEGIRLE